MVYVDCDSHILPADAFKDVEGEFEQRKPRIVTDTAGNTRVIYEAREKNIPDYSRQIPHMFNPMPWGPRLSDPSLRVADMAKAQFDMQVLVPQGSLFYHDVEPRLAAAVCRSYNNSIARILGKNAGKFIGLATVPLQDVNLAVEELERAILKLGLHAPVITTSVKHDKDLDDGELWPFYQRAEQLSVPVIVHPVNTGPIAGGWRLTRHYATRGYGFWSALGNTMENSLALANLMFGGVLDAFPKLRFCFMEGGATQVPHFFDSLDIVCQGEGDYGRLRQKPKHKPQEYLDRLYFSVRPTESLLGVLFKRYGSRNWVVGTDYPHGDAAGSWPDTVSVIQARGDLSAAAKKAVLGENALRLFGIAQ